MGSCEGSRPPARAVASCAARIYASDSDVPFSSSRMYSVQYQERDAPLSGCPMTGFEVANMAEIQQQDGGVARTGKRLFGLLGHVGAIGVGVLLMIVGLAMGVTVMLLPLGVPVGLFGLGLFLWGLFERGR